MAVYSGRPVVKHAETSTRPAVASAEHTGDGHGARAACVSRHPWVPVNFLLDALGVAPEMFGLPHDTKMRMAFISEGRGAFGSLALSEVQGVDIPESQPPYPFCIIIEVKEGRLAGILDELRGEGLQVGTAYELEQPDRTDVTITDHDGHRVTLFELHPKNKDKKKNKDP